MVKCEVGAADRQPDPADAVPAPRTEETVDSILDEILGRTWTDSKPGEVGK